MTFLSSRIRTLDYVDPRKLLRNQTIGGKGQLVLNQSYFNGDFNAPNWFACFGDFKISGIGRNYEDIGDEP